MGKRHLSLPDKLEGLFIRLEEIVLANSGENDFEEILKLVVSKLWSEINELDTFNMNNDVVKTHKEINDILSEIKRNWRGVLIENKTRLSPEHLYVCVELLSNFRLLSFGYEALDAFFEYIVSKTSKGSKGQFFTPRYVVDFCMKVLSPKAYETILDPACGSGAFLNHYYNYVSEKNHLHTSPIDSNIWGFDFDERALRVARVLMYLNGINKFNLYNANSLILPKLQQGLFDDEEKETLTSIEDFIRINKKKSFTFDIIATNPPFAGEINEEGILRNYILSKDRNNIERDALFIERCVNLLSPGGRMAIILPNNKFGSLQWEYLRSWLLKQVRVVGVVGLPRNVFMPHTPIKTAILFAEKREKTVNNPPNERIFFGISEKAGKDSRGNLEWKYKENELSQNSIDHDLEDIYYDFKDFIKQEGIGW